MQRLLSIAVVSNVGLLCKAAMNCGFCSVQVNGLPHLIAALENSKRDRGQGILTIANHISTLDDPVTWGILPAQYFFNPRNTRWALGASDIMFTNPVFSTFFHLGQTLETFRGNGIHQPALDTAIEKVNQGNWVHLYGEGKVNQPDTYVFDKDGFPRLPRFKWGVGRIVMEANIPPVVIPMWLTGYNNLMPEGRKFPYKYFPRPGAQLSVTFGDPIPTEEIKKALGVLDINSDRDSGEKLPGWLGDEANRLTETKGKTVDAAKIRSEVTAILQRAVESLGRSVLQRTTSNQNTH
ncbi:acyltransferase-domain-containing protein [Crucibulum laeve]|uniref:Tafazzin family protein n=1 Tax=Crucibulum laeve TaxID=68775 RepID=A0A5C3MCT3_9AGAR|nr:acyltransferase-domain-containing protein [Crucibulum laeve]